LRPLACQASTPSADSLPPQLGGRKEARRGGGEAVEATRPTKLPITLHHPHATLIKLYPPTSTTRIVSATHTSAVLHAHDSPPVAPPMSSAQLVAAAQPKPQCTSSTVTTRSGRHPCTVKWEEQSRPLGLPDRPLHHHSTPCRALPPRSHGCQ
jgi:hypothetical protein